MSWTRREGLWVRFVFWCAGRGKGWAQRLAAEQLERERDERIVAELLSRALASGSCIYAHVDAEGRVHWEEINMDCDCPSEDSP